MVVLSNICALLGICLIPVLSSSYVIIIYGSINSPVHEKNVVDVPNSTDKHYFKEQMKLIVKLASNDTSNIAMFPSDSKDIFLYRGFTQKCVIFTL